MPKEIRAYKLINGEEIIGQVVNDDTANGQITLEKVRTVQMMQTSPGQLGVGLMPHSAVSIDGDIKFNYSAFSSRILNIPKDMEDVYLQQTSGIQLAKAAGPMPPRPVRPPQRK